MSIMSVQVVCISCNKTYTVMVNEQKYKDWRAGRIRFIQDALPAVSAGDRELLLSQICETCFDAEFPEED